MSTFQSRLHALEGSYFRSQEQTALERYVEQLVEEGKLPKSSLELLDQNRTQTRSRPASEFVYHHKKGSTQFKMPGTSVIGLGQAVRLGGEAKWSMNDISIFDVEKAKQLAATPRREPSVFEIKRAKAIQRAANETPLVGKYRLYPTMSPTKALVWGTIVACAGMMFGTRLACLCLDIQKMGEVRGQLKKAMEPFRSSMESVFTPVNGALLAVGPDSINHSELHRFAAQLKDKFTHRQR